MNNVMFSCVSSKEALESILVVTFVLPHQTSYACKGLVGYSIVVIMPPTVHTWTCSSPPRVGPWSEFQPSLDSDFRSIMAGDQMSRGKHSVAIASVQAFWYTTLFHRTAYGARLLAIGVSTCPTMTMHLN
jgi:hypothetical protein